MNDNRELKILSYDLRQKVVEMVIEGKGGHIGRRYERDGHSGDAVL